ncbi:gluconolactonase [Azotobacter vinelandii]|nr:gluconolactonase [Azotobacter vinelandii]SFY22987.1 6-phosphogluconolactonase, cycloisomerase 2 family [Azotobacter vinelandii]
MTKTTSQRAAAVCLLAALPFAGMATENTYPLWIGSYTAGPSEGIYVHNFDSRSGTLSREPLQVVKTENPSWLAFSPDRKYLFAVNENGPGQRDIVGRVTSYRVDTAKGSLEKINEVKSLGSEPAHLSVSHDGTHLFVSNYSVAADPGGTLVVIPVDADGRLQPVSQVKTHRASQAHPERQQSPHVHSAVESPDGRYVFAQDLGADRIYVYRYDPAAHPEHPLSANEAQPFVELPPGSGPRHLVFGPDGKQAYLTLEMQGSVAVFDYADGKLTPKQNVALAAEGFQGQSKAAALHVSPDGRFLYATNRGTANELVVLRIDPDDGRLSVVSRHSVQGEEPREFTFDPSGRFILVANQNSNAIVVMERDPDTGKAGRITQSLPFPSPSDLKFASSP